MESMITFFKLCSDETRLRLLVALKHQSMCVCELCELLQESQPKVSKHLAKLKDLGFVKTDRKEQFIYYALDMKETLYIQCLNAIIMNSEKSSILSKDIRRLNALHEKPFTCTIHDESRGD